MGWTSKISDFKSIGASSIFFYLLFAGPLLILLLCYKYPVAEIQVIPNETYALNNPVASRPNIIVILADDIGYEVPTYTGGQSYQTPNIDHFAASNMQFSQCQSSPYCSPSRFMLLTGKYNFRNYERWGTLDSTEYTIANMLKDAGYATCVAGKWQLDGGDASIRKFGFDLYSVFLPFNPGSVFKEEPEDWYRYKNPHIYEQGAFLAESAVKGKYADDLFVDYIKQFIDNNTDKPFFVYYPMSLCHKPFCPTPDDPEFADWTPESRKESNRFFPSMVKYMDKKVGALIDYINDKGLASNTVILFVSDNGTPSQIKSRYKGVCIRGGKGYASQYGTHVPFVVSWPDHIAPNSRNNNIINFPDFMPLLANIANTTIPTNNTITDGINFYSSLYNPTDTIRQWGFCYWKPQTSNSVKRWSQTLNYKLYDSVNRSRFYNIGIDGFEKSPITSRKITPAEIIIKQQLQEVLDQMHQ